MGNWGYNPISRVITPLITGRGPTLYHFASFCQFASFKNAPQLEENFPQAGGGKTQTLHSWTLCSIVPLPSNSEV